MLGKILLIYFDWGKSFIINEAKAIGETITSIQRITVLARKRMAYKKYITIVMRAKRAIVKVRDSATTTSPPEVQKLVILENKLTIASE